MIKYVHIVKRLLQFHRKIVCIRRLLVMTASSTGIIPVVTVAEKSAFKKAFRSKTFWLVISQI